MTPGLAPVVLIFVALVAVAPPLPQTQWRTERRVVGDTDIVRTVGAAADAGARRLVRVFSFGSQSGPDQYLFGAITDIKRAPDGALWVFDRQVPVLRKYDSTGKFIRNVGRSGPGPGEYARSNGLVIHQDGRAVLWDQGTLRLRVYSATGEPTADWTIPGFHAGDQLAFNTSDGVRIDRSGNTYISQPLLDRAPTPGRPRAYMTIRFSRDGRKIDTVADAPSLKLAPAVITVGDRNGTMSSPVPFTPREHSAWSSDGYWVAGRSDTYAISLFKPAGRVTRIERDIVAIRTTPDQRQDGINDVEARVRARVSNWKYAGPQPAQTLPHFSELLVDNDGRIWVRAAVPMRLKTDAEREMPDEVGAASVRGAATAVMRPPGAAAASGDGRAGAGGDTRPATRPPSALRYASDIVYDVFAADGRFLGRVNMPGRFVPRVMQGDHVWSLTIDSLGVQSVTKFRIEPPLGR